MLLACSSTITITKANVLDSIIRIRGSNKTRLLVPRQRHLPEPEPVPVPVWWVRVS